MKMPALREDAVEIQVPEGWRLRRFDGASHCASHAFKAVDFILQSPEGAWTAVEVKGGALPCAPQFDLRDFVTKMRSDDFHADLVRKFRDTWLYHWALSGREARWTHYIVLVVLPDPPTRWLPSLLALQDDLRRRMPVGIPRGCAWERTLVRRVGIVLLTPGQRPHAQVGRLQFRLGPCS